MSKEEKKAKKLAKKEAKAAKKEAKAAKANAKYEAKQAKKHEKAYNKFVKKTEKKNKKLSAKGAAAIAIPAIDVFQTKKEIKAAKATSKAYAKYVKKINKKNAKAEKKCAKKGKPYVPIAVPTEEEFAASAGNENKTKKIILMILLLLLIWFLIYFIIIYINYEYVAPVHEDTTVSEEAGPRAEYESYTNIHEITTTPTYDIADAKRLLQQTIHDNWKVIGYSKDASSSAISFNNRIETVNGAECYMFTCSGRTFAVATNLSAVYHAHDGSYEPLSFNRTGILFD